jgi:hypothetical protein
MNAITLDVNAFQGDGIDLISIKATPVLCCVWLFLSLQVLGIGSE